MSNLACQTRPFAVKREQKVGGARARARTRVLVVSGTIVSPPLVRKHLAPGRQEPTPE